MIGLSPAIEPFRHRLLLLLLPLVAVALAGASFHTGVVCAVEGRPGSPVRGEQLSVT